MGLSSASKLLVLVATAYVFSVKAQASWSWASSQSGPDSSEGLSSRGSDSNSSGSTWGYVWTSNGTDTNWAWGNNSGLNHSSNIGYTSNNYTVPSNHSSSIDSTSNNHTVPISPEREIVVTVWKSGFDYQEWASMKAPFYIDDVLVFTNDQPNQTQSKKQNKNNNKDNVFLLPDLRSYERCDVTRGKKLVARGKPSSEGFKLILSKTQPYFLASGDNKSCTHNSMKFSLYPIPRPASY